MARNIIVAFDGSHGNAPSLIWLNSFAGIIFLLCMIFTSFAATSFVIFVCGLSSGESPRRDESRRNESNSEDEAPEELSHGEEIFDAIDAMAQAAWAGQANPQDQHGHHHHDGGGGGGGSGGGGGGEGGGGGCGGFGGLIGGALCGHFGGDNHHGHQHVGH